MVWGYRYIDVEKDGRVSGAKPDATKGSIDTMGMEVPEMPADAVYDLYYSEAEGLHWVKIMEFDDIPPTAEEKLAAIQTATATIQTGVDGLKEEKSAKVELEKAQKAGATAMQMAVKAGADVTEQISVFKKAYPEWMADGGTEEVDHISYYPKTDMVYICIGAAQRIAVYSPDLATNNYCPYPEPDENGVYPYIYGMLVWGGMKVKYEGTEYRCILADGSKYKLTYTPDQVPSVFTKEGGE